MNINMKKINSITPYNNNPRNNSSAVDIVASSIKEFGFKNPIVVDKNGVIINGHTRYLAAKSLGLEEVPVLIADDLTDEQVKAFRIMDNKSSEFAEWDYEKLVAELEDIKLANLDIELTGFNDIELEELNKTFEDIDIPNFDFEPNTQLEDEDKANIDNTKYTSKIDIPHYEVKGVKPLLNTLVKEDKAKELIDEIKVANITEEEKEFLIKAAYRHLAFNYQNVAEYYAHASNEVQELMEKSALVIIDYNDAIKNGYIQIKEAINSMIEEVEEDV